MVKLKGSKTFACGCGKVFCAVVPARGIRGVRCPACKVKMTKSNLGQKLKA